MPQLLLSPRRAFLALLVFQRQTLGFLLESGSSRSRHNWYGGRPCGLFQPKDLDRPIRKVLAEHPGIPPSCVYDGANQYISYDPWTASPDYNYHRKLPDDYCMNGETYLGENQGPEVTVEFDGLSVTTHLDCPYFGYDDLFYYSLGWLKNQRFDAALMSNKTAWEDLTRKECERLQQEFQYTDEEMTFNHWNAYNMEICNRLECSKSGKYKLGVCKPITRRDFGSHAYGYCLLGTAPSCIAFSQARACLLPGNVVGHRHACNADGSNSA